MPFMRGAIPSKAHKLQAQLPFKYYGPVPTSVVNTRGVAQQMDGNERYGDCTCACLGNVLDVVKNILGYSGGPIPDENVVSWAIRHGFQNGAQIIDVLDTLASEPMLDTAGQACVIGLNAGVDYTDTNSVYGALAGSYALDLGVDAQPLQDCGAGNSKVITMPVLSRVYGNLDHSIPAFDYGTAKQLADAYNTAYNVSVSLGSVGENEPCITVSTWSSLVITPLRSFNLFTGEAHVILNFPAPTVVPPAPTPVPGPGPQPRPRPTQRGLEIANALAAHHVKNPAKVENLLDIIEKLPTVEEALAEFRATFSEGRA